MGKPFDLDVVFSGAVVVLAVLRSANTTCHHLKEPPTTPGTRNRHSTYRDWMVPAHVRVAPNRLAHRRDRVGRALVRMVQVISQLGGPTFDRVTGVLKGGRIFLAQLIGERADRFVHLIHVRLQI